MTDSSSPSDVESTLLQSRTQASDEIVLRIRNSFQPPSGNGLFHTLVPLRARAKEKVRQAKNDNGWRSTSITPPPCSASSKLQREFYEILHAATSTGLRMHTLGRWLEMCIPRIGTNPVLDRSIACLIAGHKTRYGRDDQAMRSGRHRYGESLTMLRDVVASGVEAITADIIAATKMLMLYEYVYQGFAAFRWRYDGLRSRCWVGKYPS